MADIVRVQDANSRTSALSGLSAYAGPVRRGWRSGRLGGPARATVLLLVVYLIFSLQSVNFYASTNTRSLLAYAVPAGLIAVGQTLVIALGEIDLSVASVAVLSGIVLVVLEPHGLLIAFSGAIGVGVAAGLFNGLITAIGKVPSLVATLAASFIAQGIAFIIASKPVSGTRLDLTARLDQPIGQLLSLRIIIGAVLVILAAVVFGLTPIGRAFYARGSNPDGARLLGLPGRSLVIGGFLSTGILSAGAGIILAISLNSGSPVIGGDLLLLSIAACLIGGSRLEGGTGSVIGTVVALLALLALQSGMDQLGVSSYWQQVVRGAVVLVALLAATESRVGGLSLRRRLTVLTRRE